MSTSQDRPVVTELRLSSFKSHRGASFSLGPLTLLAGESGTGKSSVLEALSALSRLACGDGLDEVFRTVVRGGAAACVPQEAQPDAEGRRGFRIGCTVSGPLGQVRLDVAVQAEPTLRIVGERLTGMGETLLTTALRDPSRPSVQAAWHTAGTVAVTRAPLPDDRLATALLPLRVSGRTEGQRLVLAAAEQTVVALRGVFAVAPRPELMRGPVPRFDGRLRAACDNLSAVLARTEGECGTRHAALVNAVRAACSTPIEGLTVVPAQLPAENRGADGRGAAGRGVDCRSAGGGAGGRGSAGQGSGEATLDAVMAAVDRGPLGLVPIDRLGDGELRFLALALVLLTGPGVLDVDTSTELLPASQVLTVLADGIDHGLDSRQLRELLRLAGLAAGRGHIRLLGTVQDASALEGLGGVTVTTLGGRHRVPEQDAGSGSGGGAGQRHAGAGPGSGVGSGAGSPAGAEAKAQAERGPAGAHSADAGAADDAGPGDAGSVEADLSEAGLADGGFPDLEGSPAGGSESGGSPVGGAGGAGGAGAGIDAAGPGGRELGGAGLGGGGLGGGGLGGGGLGGGGRAEPGLRAAEQGDAVDQSG